MKVIFGTIIAMFLLAGCGEQTPEEFEKEFLTAYKKAEITKLNKIMTEKSKKKFLKLVNRCEYPFFISLFVDVELSLDSYLVSVYKENFKEYKSSIENIRNTNENNRIKKDKITAILRDFLNKNHLPSVRVEDSQKWENVLVNYFLYAKDLNIVDKDLVRKIIKKEYMIDKYKESEENIKKCFLAQSKKANVDKLKVISINENKEKNEAKITYINTNEKETTYHVIMTNKLLRRKQRSFLSDQKEFSVS